MKIDGITMISNSTEIDSIETGSAPRYSICTFVTNKKLYNEMLESFRKAGFANDKAEFIYIDNSDSNKYDGFRGVNKFLNVARGEYIIICHQDVVLHDHDITRLDKVISEISALDPSWALLGNAGGVGPGRIALRITDPHHGQNATIGSLPAKVQSLDENFILIKKSANLGVSNDLRGFHFMGTDICFLAAIHGYSAYVVDFHLWHIGGDSRIKDGVKTKFLSSFDECKRNFINKYRQILSPKWLQTSCTMIYMSNSGIRNYIFNRKHVYSIRKRIYRWFAR